MKLYLDMDGVLADFDKGARQALGTDNSYKWEFVHGTEAFWSTLNAQPNFWALDPMPDFNILWAAVKDLKPSVLTALPKKNDAPVALAKRDWVNRYCGRDIEVITCLTSEKAKYAYKGSILVDDRAVNEKPWREKGGNFILHRDAMSTISILKDMRVL